MPEHPLFPRHARPLVLEALADTRVVLVMGARQAGKSTLTRAISTEDRPARILTLDDKTTRDSAIADPTAFIAGIVGPVLLDEVQRSPELLLAIKEAVDRDPTPGRFLLTGSANVLTAPKVYEALTGRIEIVRLWPLSRAEVERSDSNVVDALFAARPPQITGAPIGRDAFVERAAQGGYPEARLRSGSRRDRWFENYLTTTFERDLRELADVQKLEELSRLLRLLATQTANLFVSANLAGRLRISDKTVESYTRLLETIFLIKRLPAWRPGLGAREIHAPKTYLVDTGLLAHLLGADEQRIRTDDQITGKVFENFVTIEILKHSEWAVTRTRQYHYRDGRDEVDLVLENRAGELVAIEAKAAATINERDYRTLRKLRDRRQERFLAGVVMYTGAETIPLSERIWAVPVSSLWTP